MHKLLLVLLLLTPAQSPTAQTQPQPNLAQALTGDWTGVLEYGDYKEPANSTKRVQLPTWLSIKAVDGAHLTRHFIYDDGPGKTVDSTDDVAIDQASSSYTETTAGKPAQLYTVSGYETLKSGRGDLTLMGSGTDNNKPAQIRITLTIRRNLLMWIEETRPAGSTEPFAFRHSYTFVRAQAPAVTSH